MTLDRNGVLCARSWIPARTGAAAAAVSLALVVANTIHAADEPTDPAAAAVQEKPTPSYRSGIGPTFSDSSDPTTSLARCKRNLADAERLNGAKSQQAAAAMLNVAGHHGEWGQPAKADPMFRRAVETHEAAYGKNSAKTALCLIVYADFLVKESRSREAVPLLERAITIHERISGPDHPETVLAVRSLGEVKEQLGHEDDARALLDRERMSRERIPPQVAPTACDDPDYFRAHEHVGARLFAAGAIDAADYHFRRAVQLRPDLGENHNNLASTLSARAQALAQQGEQAAAERESDAAIKEFAEACRLTPHVPAIRVNLANALAAAGRFGEAADVYEELVAREPNNAMLLHNYGVSLYRQGKKEQAIAHFRQALEIDPDLEDAKASLAVALGEKPDPGANPTQPPERPRTSSETR